MKNDITSTRMKASNGYREWSSKERLPAGFADWLKEIVAEQEDERSFRKIADELGVKPSILSRWMAGMGPMKHKDIRLLSSKLGPVVYTFLGFPRPDYT